MPIYEYTVDGEGGCSECSSKFEVFQSLSARPLRKCPACGARVRRVFSTTAIHGEGSSGQTLSNKNLAEKGFTKYEKSGDGVYEKKAGSGPDVIHR